MTELTVIDCTQPPPTDGGTQLVSLSAELAMLRDALTAISSMVEHLTAKSPPTAETVAQVPIAINGVLVLVNARISHLRRVLSCEADPRELLAAHNADPEPTTADDSDLRLRPWTATQRAAHLARMLEKAHAEARREGPPQPEP